MRILDPRSLGVGAVVARSAWYVGSLTGRSRRTRARRQLGILTSVAYDAEDGLWWPVVHWEGEIRAALAHPRGVRPLRRTRRARYLSTSSRS